MTIIGEEDEVVRRAAAEHTSVRGREDAGAARTTIPGPGLGVLEPPRPRGDAQRAGWVGFAPPWRGVADHTAGPAAAANAARRRVGDGSGLQSTSGPARSAVVSSGSCPQAEDVTAALSAASLPYPRILSSPPPASSSEAGRRNSGSFFCRRPRDSGQVVAIRACQGTSRRPRYRAPVDWQPRSGVPGSTIRPASRMFSYLWILRLLDGGGTASTTG